MIYFGASNGQKVQLFEISSLASKRMKTIIILSFLYCICIDVSFQNKRSVQSCFYFEAVVWTTLCILRRFWTTLCIHRRKFPDVGAVIFRIFSPFREFSGNPKTFRKKSKKLWWSHFHDPLSILRFFPKPETLMLLMLFANDKNIDTFFSVSEY